MEKVKLILDEAQSFALLADEKTSEHALLAREALRSALQIKGLPCYCLKSLPQNFKEKWQTIFPRKEDQENFIQKTVIKIPKHKHKINEVSYEEGEDDFSFIISSSNGAIDSSDLFFESHLPQVDSAFCFTENKEALEFFKKKINLPPSDKIVFLSENHRPFAEKVMDIIKIIDSELLSDKIATLLFASLVIETENFTKNIEPNVLAAGSEMLEARANQQIIKEILNETRDYPFTQLLGRALARTRKDKTMESSWTFLSKEDMEKTGNSDISAEFFHKILKEVKKTAPAEKISLLLWQNEDEIWAIVETGDKELILAEIAFRLNIPTDSKFLLAGPYSSFQEAENKLQDAIKEVL